MTAEASTAFARLTAMLARVSDAGGLEDVIEFNPGPDDSGPEVVELLLLDVALVLARLADVCPEHGACVGCGREMCGSCGVGGSDVCEHGIPPVCESCNPADYCGACHVEQQERDAEARLDGAA